MWTSFLVSIAFKFLESFVLKKKTDSESRKAFLKMADVLRTAGAKSVKSRFEAESQIEAGEEAWKNRENPEVESAK